VPTPLQLPKRYVPVQQLGEGAFGVVLRCRDAELRRDVAIKVLKQEVCDDGTTTRFRREAEASAQVQHPHVVAVYDAGVTEGGRPFIVSEFVEGASLDDVLKERGRIPPEQAHRWVTQLLGALETVHAAGLVHRDVKPANVMLRDDQALLCDFGLSRFIDNQTRLTATGMVVGTPAYFAPELMRSEDSAPGSDLFALGALGYELAYGERWWRARNLPDLVGQASAYFEIDTTRFGKDPELDALLIRLLDPDPDVRTGAVDPTTASSGLGQSAIPTGPGSPLAPPASPQASSGGVGARALLALVVAAGLGIGLLGPGAAPEEPTSLAPTATQASTAPTTPAEEPTALAAARRGLGAGAPHPGPADALLGDQVRAAFPAIVDPRTTLKLRRLVTTLAEQAQAPHAVLADSLDVLDRATARFRVGRAIAVQATLGGLQPTLDSVGDAEFTAEEGEALRRANQDLEKEALRLLNALPSPDATATKPEEDVVLSLRLYLYRIRLDHVSSEPMALAAAGRVATAKPAVSLRLAAGLWSVLNLDEKERVLTRPGLVTIMGTLAQGLADRPRSPDPGALRLEADTAAEALALGAIALRRLGDEAPGEAFRALDSLGATLASYQDVAPEAVTAGLARARRRLTDVGPLRAAPGPALQAAGTRLAGLG
jgi:serine/threonine-protein kinase